MKKTDKKEQKKKLRRLTLNRETIQSLDHAAIFKLVRGIGTTSMPAPGWTRCGEEV